MLNKSPILLLPCFLDIHKRPGLWGVIGVRSPVVAVYSKPYFAGTLIGGSFCKPKLQVLNTDVLVRAHCHWDKECCTPTMVGPNNWDRAKRTTLIHAKVEPPPWTTVTGTSK
jgi:hypothetical protein